MKKEARGPYQLREQYSGKHLGYFVSREAALVWARKHLSKSAPLVLEWVGRKRNPSAVLTRKLPMSKWKRAKVRRLPGGKFQVKVD